MYGSWTLLDFVRLGFIQTYDCTDRMIMQVLNIVIFNNIESVSTWKKYFALS